MPQAWPLVGGQHMAVDGYAGNDAEKQIQLVRDYMISLGTLVVIGFRSSVIG